jgi:hypothetical protein
MRAVTESQPIHQAIPFLQTDVQQLSKIRRQLEGVFRELRLIQDVIIVCGGVREALNSDFDSEVEHVLRRCGSERMATVLKTMNQIIERFGGSTEITEARAQEQSAA